MTLGELISMGEAIAGLPCSLVLSHCLREWLLEDVGRGDVTTDALMQSVALREQRYEAIWRVKAPGVIVGLTVAAEVFRLIDPHLQVTFEANDGDWCESGTTVLRLNGSLQALLTGERTALNLAMRLSGIATMTRSYVGAIADLPARLVDTRKTTPGLRVLEKYASRLGGAINHRLGLDDAVMLKDNHIAAAGGIGQAIALVRAHSPFPLTIEVETETLDMVAEAIEHKAAIIMLDNMPLEMMRTAVQMIREASDHIQIEASGNVTLETIRAIAETGVDYISSSAPITRSPWLDLSMRIVTSHVR